MFFTNLYENLDEILRVILSNYYCAFVISLLIHKMIVICIIQVWCEHFGLWTEDFSYVDLHYRRIRTVFDGAVSVYRTIQERDIEVGRNLGNRILRWLDRMKPEAQIRGQSPPPPKINSNTTNQLNNQPKPTDKKSDRHLFTASRSILPKNPTIAMMMQPARSIGHNTI